LLPSAGDSDDRLTDLTDLGVFADPFKDPFADPFKDPLDLFTDTSSESLEPVEERESRDEVAESRDSVEKEAETVRFKR